MPLGYTDSDVARNFGHTCHRTFPGCRWEDCEAPIRKTWGLLDVDLPWERAKAFIHAGWDAAESADGERPLPPRLR